MFESEHEWRRSVNEILDKNNQTIFGNIDIIWLRINTFLTFPHIHAGLFKL